MRTQILSSMSKLFTQSMGIFTELHTFVFAVSVMLLQGLHWLAVGNANLDFSFRNLGRRKNEKHVSQEKQQIKPTPNNPTKKNILRPGRLWCPQSISNTNSNSYKASLMSPDYVLVLPAEGAVSKVWPPVLWLRAKGSSKWFKSLIFSKKINKIVTLTQFSSGSTNICIFLFWGFVCCCLVCCEAAEAWRSDIKH